LVLLDRTEIKDNKVSRAKKGLLGPRVGRDLKGHQDLLELKARG
jgi:hypothetical protein